MPELEMALKERLGGSVVVSADDLDGVWWSLFDETFASRRGRAAFLGCLRWLDTGTAHGTDMEFRLGGWEIDLGKTAVQAGLVSAFLGGVLAVIGVDQVPVEVLPTVVPLIFDISRSRLTASQEYVLAQLVVQPEVRGGSLTAAELYARLPEATRTELSRVDFEDFLDACRRAGLARSEGDTVSLAPAHSPRFRVSFR